MSEIKEEVKEADRKKKDFCDHLTPGRRKDYTDRKVSSVRRSHQSGGKCKRQGHSQTCGV